MISHKVLGTMKQVPVPVIPRPTSSTTILRSTRRNEGLTKPSTASIEKTEAKPSCLARNNIQLKTEKVRLAYSVIVSSTTSAVPATPQSGAIFLKQNRGNKFKVTGCQARCDSGCQARCDLICYHFIEMLLAPGYQSRKCRHE